jgi:hypothetical protein
VETCSRRPSCVAPWIINRAEDMKLPPLKKQSTPQAVLDEHMDALNECDWNRIMAQYQTINLICRMAWSLKAGKLRPRFSRTSLSRMTRVVCAA